MDLSKLTREQLTDFVKSNNKRIEELQNHNLEIIHASYLLTDKRQQYKEEVVTLGRGKTKRTEPQGWIYWNQIFIDNRTGEEFEIERSKLVKINNKWI